MLDRAPALCSLLLAALCLMPAAAQAQIYRWTDEQGRVQHGDRPPPGVQATQIGGKAATAPKLSDEESRRRAQEQRDQWASVIYRSSEQADRQQLAQQQGQAGRPGPPRGNGTHAAPQGDCRRYQYLQGLVRSGQLHRCNGPACVKATPQEIEMIEREARVACGSR